MRYDQQIRAIFVYLPERSAIQNMMSEMHFLHMALLLVTLVIFRVSFTIANRYSSLLFPAQERKKSQTVPYFTNIYL